MPVAHPRRFPIAATLGFHIAELGDGTATIVLPTDARHENTRGTIHGGVMCDIADAAMGNAFRTGIPAGEGFTTVELKINFLRPAVPGDTLTAAGRVVWRGRRLGYTEASVTNQRGELVARAVGTCIVIEKKPE